ncbi:MAG: hypothetical protein AAF998_18325 [Bacteroidota bacterium]
MKTIFTLFITLSTILIMSAAPLSAQSVGDYLTLQISSPEDDKSVVIYYPEGTTYEVLDTDAKPVGPTRYSTGERTYTGEVQVIVYPYWNPEGERRYIRDGFNIYTTDAAASAAGYGLKWKPGNKLKPRRGAESHPTGKTQPDTEKQSQEFNVYGAYVGGIRAKKSLRPSTQRDNAYNVTLTFDNGLVFTYEDGAVEASMDRKPLEIQGKYIIVTPDGTAKISFDPESGELWYVFDRK